MVTDARKAFDPSEHFLKLKGKDYLPVAWRLVWFRAEHPEWGIATRLVEHDAEAGRAVFVATIDCGEAYAGVLASGHKMETRKNFPDYLEKAETGAIGRALAAMGYGTQFAAEFEEGGLADSPIEKKGYVPTDVRDADDADIVRSADDETWKDWLRLRDIALSLNVKLQKIQLPINRKDLREYGRQVRDDVVARKKQVTAK